jgi:hypothetical protein
VSDKGYMNNTRGHAKGGAKEYGRKNRKNEKAGLRAKGKQITRKLLKDARVKVSR